MSGKTIFGGFNKYVDELSSSGGSIYAGLGVGAGKGAKGPKMAVIGLGALAAIILGINFYLYSQMPEGSSSSTSRSNRRGGNRQRRNRGQ